MPCESGFDPSSHLSWGDLAVDVPGQPSVTNIRLKASKADPFRKGITLFIGKVSSALCPGVSHADLPVGAGQTG